MQRQKSYDDTPTLYLVPTPIGNLEDMTYRAVNVLKSVNIIFSEDTRVTRQLLNYFEINKKLISNHEYNEFVVKEKIEEELKKGNSVALVSDRGTPAISDPGLVAAKYIIEKGYNVVCLPGANALIPAVVMSGLDTKPFMFYGFLNSKKTKQVEELENLKYIESTLIFYEAPHRLKSTLTTIKEILGNRNISLVREISKLHEEVIRAKISDVLEVVDSLKGEFVIVVDKYYKKQETFDDLTIVEHVKKYVIEGLNEKDAIKKVAKLRGVIKNEIYKEYHKD